MTDSKAWPGGGSWIGSPALGAAVTAALGSLAAWTTTGQRVADADSDVVVDATALDSYSPPSAHHAARVVHLTAVGDPDRAAMTGAVIAHARSSALANIGEVGTVNVVVVPDGFPDHPPSPTAPVTAPIGVDDLAHVLRYLLDPANGYVTGQVISIRGGDDVWGL